MLLRVKLEWLLFDGAWAAEHLGKVSKADLRNNAVKYWPQGFRGKELLSFLRSQNDDV